MNLYQEHFAVMIERMPAISGVLQAIKLGYNEVISSTISEFQGQIEEI